MYTEEDIKKYGIRKDKNVEESLSIWDDAQTWVNQFYQFMKDNNIATLSELSFNAEDDYGSTRIVVTGKKQKTDEEIEKDIANAKILEARNLSVKKAQYEELKKQFG